MCASQILSQYVEVTTVDNLVLDKAKEIIFDNARTEEWRYGFLASLRSECSDRNPATGETLSRETATQLFSVNAPNSDDNQCLVRATPPLPPAQPALCFFLKQSMFLVTLSTQVGKTSCQNATSKPYVR